MSRPSGSRALPTLLAVTALSLPSGLPLGVVTTAVPTWLSQSGVDVKTLGMLVLAQAPWAFKFLWAPLVDSVASRRAVIGLAQALLALALVALGVSLQPPSVAAVAGLSLVVSFLAATHDIALDAYAVESLEAGDVPRAAGFRTAVYRGAMWLGGNLAVYLGPLWGWPVTTGALAALFVASVAWTWAAPPEPPSGRSAHLGQAVWAPLVSFLARPEAVALAGFLVLYKLADNLAVNLVSPFLVAHGYAPFDVGPGVGAVTLLGASSGAVLGGFLTARVGVGRALWSLGLVQMASNLGYAVLAALPVSRPLLYGAVAVETFTSGLGTAAFSVLLLRLTEKRYSATQFALLSSLFALGRTLSGPPAGALAWAVGWRDFFILSVAAGLPGLWLLHRFAPYGQRDVPALESSPPPPSPRRKVPLGELWRRGLVLGAASALLALVGLVGLAGLKGLKAGAPPGQALQVVWALLPPRDVAAGLDLVGVLAFGALGGLAGAAALAARGAGPSPGAG